MATATDSRIAFDTVTDAALAQRRITPAGVEVLRSIMRVESGGDSAAKNPESTATGCFQFLKGTWCEQITKHGALYGRGDLAKKIRYDAASRSYVGVGLTQEERDKNLSEVLALRCDPTLATQMAIEFTHDNESALKKAGFPVTPATVYLAHFLGAGDGARGTKGAGAVTLLQAEHDNPNMPIRKLLHPDVRNANASIAFGGKKFQDFTARDLHQWATMKMKPKDWDIMPEPTRQQWKKEHALPENAPDAEGEFSVVEFVVKSLIVMSGAVVAIGAKLVEVGASMVGGDSGGSSLLAAQIIPLAAQQAPAAPPAPRIG